jgi:hypothetical protein
VKPGDVVLRVNGTKVTGQDSAKVRRALPSHHMARFRGGGFRRKRPNDSSVSERSLILPRCCMSRARPSTSCAATQN